MTLIQFKKVLGSHWPTQDPFLFLVHHEDNFPKGNEQLGPREFLANTNFGSDFETSRAWRMYHGQKVPGFPMHPHRGFETVTLVLDGVVDHFDSAGGSGRYGKGDTQWMTAGSGLQHSEMFPLVHQQAHNPLHLFQIWLNLPSRDKFATPSYKMFWAEETPEITVGNSCAKVISGKFGDVVGIAPPPNSWAANPENQVRIMTIDLSEGEILYLKAESIGTLRSIYSYSGEELCLCAITSDEIAIDFPDGEGLYSGSQDRYKRIDKAKSSHVCSLLPVNQMAALKPEDMLLWAEKSSVKLLYLAANPIGEPVTQYGPFVMNKKSEIQQAFWDYENTHFGGWPWKSTEPVHPANIDRHAQYGNGIISKP